MPARNRPPPPAGRRSASTAAWSGSRRSASISSDRRRRDTASTDGENATALLRAVASGDANLATRELSPGGVVQHDPTVADGIAGLREQAGRSTRDLQVARLLADGPFVVVHGRTDEASKNRNGML